MRPVSGLYTTQVGESGPWVVFCHGLFGQGRNWNGVAKALAGPAGDRHRSLLVDLPDHGRSPWSERFDYVLVADQLAETLRSLDAPGSPDAGPVAVVGHSMGGKVAMLLALRHPDLVERLCVVDIAPVVSDAQHGFGAYVAAMRGLDLAALGRRGDADERLAAAVPDATVRGFLLQNLRHDRDGWHWQLNLEVLGDQLDAIGGWPVTTEGASYAGAVLWIAGQGSDYVRTEHHATMAALFPRVQKVTIKGAGHWVHSEQPAVFVEVLRRFLDGPA